jgi:hypothetical protein
VLFDLPAHIHDGIGVGRFQHIAIFGDDRGVPSISSCVEQSASVSLRNRI